MTQPEQPWEVAGTREVPGWEREALERLGHLIQPCRPERRRPWLFDAVTETTVAAFPKEWRDSA